MNERVLMRNASGYPIGYAAVVPPTDPAEIDLSGIVGRTAPGYCDFAGMKRAWMDACEALRTFTPEAA